MLDKSQKEQVASATKKLAEKYHNGELRVKYNTFGDKYFMVDVNEIIPEMPTDNYFRREVCTEINNCFYDYLCELSELYSYPKRKEHLVLFFGADEFMITVPKECFMCHAIVLCVLRY